MNDIQIECFLITASVQNYTKAAEFLNLSQPTVSRYIAGLEEELQCRLLHRTTKKVEMTEAGRRYYRLFSHWKVEMAETREEVLRLLGRANHRLRIGYLEGWPMQREIVEACAAFERQYPYIDVKFVMLGASEIMNALFEENLDLAIVLENLQMDMSYYGKKKICDIHKAILYSVNHPLADKEDLCAKDFEKETFFVVNEDMDYVLKRNQDLYTQFHFGTGIRTAENIHTLYMNVANGLGVTIQDEWGPVENKSLYRTLVLEDTVEIFLVWKNPHSKEDVDVFERFFTDHFHYP